MSDINEKKIRKRFDDISKHTISPEVASRDLQRVRQTLTEQPVASEAMQPTIWRMIMQSRITKPAAAAAILVGVLVGVSYFDVNSSSVAWAEVAENTQQIRSCVFRSWATVTGNMPGLEHAPNVETVTYMDSEYGTRHETYMNDNLSFVMYMVPHDESVVSVMPETKSYMRMKMPTDGPDKIRQQSGDPREIVKVFTASGYKEIGRSTIDGIEVEGIEFDDPNVFGGMFSSFKGQLWVDVDTELPVRIEYETSSLNGDMQMKMVMGDFQWGLELDPSQFEPDIPDDYTLTADVQIAGTTDVHKVVEGLRMFSEMADGKFPSSLDLMTVTKESTTVLTEALMETMGSGPNNEPGHKPDPEQMKEFTSMMMTMQTPATVYMQLVQKDQDPAYYGDKVTTEDADAVLLRWKVSETEYQVILGDLTTENVTAEQLTELEKTSSQ